jgi:SH3 domain protein
MKKIMPVTLLVLICATLLSPMDGWAAKAFITERNEVTLRSGPGKQNKPVISLPPGTAVEVVKGTEWTLVRYTTEAGETKNGWVPTRSLGSRPPEETMIRQLEDENTALKQSLAALEKEKAELARVEKELADKLGKLDNSYESLKSGSANFLQLKNEYDTTLVSLSQAEEKIRGLAQENENLKISQKIRWFAAGAMVLFVGLMIGWASGRRQRKRRPAYFF